MSKLELVPITLREANAFIEMHHRHHGKSVGCRFCIGAARDGEVIAVAIVSNPRARMLNDGHTAEVVRLCSVEGRQSNGHASGACSFLYAACWRAARSIGYRKLVTYLLDSEDGKTLVAVGWTEIGSAGGGTWSRKDRPRVDTHPTQTKIRWEMAA